MLGPSPCPNPPRPPAEVFLPASLNSCLVNLQPSLVAVLTNANTLTQNVVVELTLPPAAAAQARRRQRPPGLGPALRLRRLDGLSSRSRPAPVVGRGGIAGVRGNAPVREHEVATVELDPVFARLVALSEGQKVGIMLHVDRAAGAHDQHRAPDARPTGR